MKINTVGLLMGLVVLAARIAMGELTGPPLGEDKAKLNRGAANPLYYTNPLRIKYQIYEDQPGGRRFDRMDTKNAKEIRLKVYRFLEQHLNPPRPFENMQALQRASYGF